MLLPPDHPDAPKYWLHETSGELVPAVHAYLAGERLNEYQIRLVKLYLWQWVRSPVWGPSGALESLKLRVAAIATSEDIARALKHAVDLGMDPL
jgi:hypothetical protein